MAGPLLHIQGPWADRMEDLRLRRLDPWAAHLVALDLPVGRMVDRLLRLLRLMRPAVRLLDCCSHTHLRFAPIVLPLLVSMHSVESVHRRKLENLLKESLVLGLQKKVMDGLQPSAPAALLSLTTTWLCNDGP